jgi:hypothetical protein
VPGWLCQMDPGPGKYGKTCWGLQPGSTANGIVNLLWLAILLGTVIAFAITI